MPFVVPCGMQYQYSASSHKVSNFVPDHEASTIAATSTLANDLNETLVHDTVETTHDAELMFPVVFHEMDYQMNDLKLSFPQPFGGSTDTTSEQYVIDLNTYFDQVNSL